MVNLGHWRHLRGHHLTPSFKYWYCLLPPVNPRMSQNLNWKGSFCLPRTGGLEWETGPELAKIKHTFLDMCISSSTDSRSFIMSVPTNVSSRHVDPDANNKKMEWLSYYRLQLSNNAFHWRILNAYTMIGALIEELGFCICKTRRATIQRTRLPENNEAHQLCQEWVYSSFFLRPGSDSA